MVPWITKAQVVSQSPPNKVMVLYPSGQMPGIPVTVVSDGPADALRVKQHALPTPGTWGVVAFPAGDIRNGVWLGSLYAQNVQAYTNTTDPHFEYDSHYSGYYKWLDQTGNQNIYYPDGTAIVVGTATTADPTFRQVVNPDQSSSSVEFTSSQRVPSPPSPFNTTINHATGAKAQITSTGAVNVEAANGQTITLSVNGASIQIDASGNINIDAAAGKAINLSQGGASLADTLVLTNSLISAYNAHVHSDPEGGNTGTPTTQLTASDIGSTLVNVSN